MVTTCARRLHFGNQLDSLPDRLSGPAIDTTRRQSFSGRDSQAVLVGVPIECARMLQSFLDDSSPHIALQRLSWHDSGDDSLAENLERAPQHIVLGRFAQDLPHDETLLTLNRELAKQGTRCLIWSNSPTALTARDDCRVEYGIDRTAADRIATWLRQGTDG
jgi:hypothetical protein